MEGINALGEGHATLLGGEVLSGGKVQLFHLDSQPRKADGGGHLLNIYSRRALDTVSMLHRLILHSQPLALRFKPEAIPLLLSCSEGSLTAHCPSHCHTYVSPDLWLGSTAIIVIYRVSDLFQVPGNMGRVGSGTLQEKVGAPCKKRHFPKLRHLQADETALQLGPMPQKLGITAKTS